MTDIPIHKSKPVRIKARVNETSVPQVFVFKNEDGSPHDISGYDFKTVVYKRANSNIKLFTLSIGDGHTIQGDDNNKLLIEVSRSRSSQTPDTYFFRFLSSIEDHTWFAGPWEFFIGEGDAVQDDTPIVVSSSGDSVTITVVGNGADSSVMTFDQQ